MGTSKLPNRFREVLPLLVVSSLIAGGLYIWRLWLLPVHVYGHDELQHLHIAWCRMQGMVMYRDFFDHHTPWYTFILSGLMHSLNVTTDIEHAFTFITMARVISWLITLATLGLTFQLARQWFEARVAFVAVAFLASTIMFLDRTIEIRPDVLAVFFWVACMVSLHAGLRCDARQFKHAYRMLFVSGFAIGSALMCTQKLLFAGPGMAVVMIWYLFDSRHSMPNKRKWIGFFWQLLGLILPIAITLVAFATKGALGDFIECNFLINSGWKVHFPWTRYGLLLIDENPIQMLFAGMGLVVLFVRMFSRTHFLRADYAITLPLLSLMAGARIIPVPYKQYFILMLPALAIIAAWMLVTLVTHATVTFRRDKYRLFIYACGIGMVLIGIVGWVIRPSIGQKISEEIVERWPLGVAALWFAGAVLVSMLIRNRTNPNYSLALVMAILAVFPIIQINRMFDETNDQQQRVISFVMRRVTPVEPVFDGWPARAPFRPHAWRYFFPHREMRAMLTQEQIDAFLEDLKDGHVQPRVAILDENSRAISDELTAWFEANYDYTGFDNIYIRKKED